MRAYLLSLALLAAVAFSLSTCLEPWFQSWAGSRTKSDNVVQVALGDGRKLFARHVFLKADAYFHNGYYPTIYDNKEGYEKAHIAQDMHKHGEDEEDGENFLGKPKDWIDQFSRHFYPARHTHLGDSGCGHSCCQRAKKGEGHDENCAHKDHHDGDGGGDEREILPWLRLSAELDPERVETYVVSAYWLRKALKKVDEAEQFLREGLQANPGDCEILFELGCIYDESRDDLARARNVWELALKNWRERESGKQEPNVFIYARILGHLATLEEKQKNYARAIEHLTALKTVSPNKEAIQKWIDDLSAKKA
jgi:tetratricopeptide (TPR) repeat protein